MKENGRPDVVAERLLEQMRIRHISSKREFAKICGISEAFLNQILSGGKTGERKWVDIAKNLGVSVEYLTGAQNLIKVVAVVCGSEAFNMDVNQLLESIDITQIPGISHKRAESLYALRVKGHSMVPVFKDGDTLIVEKDSFTKIRFGDKVIYRERPGQAVLRYVEIVPEGIRLQCLTEARIVAEREMTELAKMDKVIHVLAS
jgi:hypothetical protein